MLCDAKWLFFDMGSTLIDETVCWQLRIEHTVCGSGVTPDAFMFAMTQHAEAGRDPYAFALRAFHLREKPWPLNAERPYLDAQSVLSALHRRYHIGIISNQVPGVRDRLHAFGLLPYIDIVAVSCELGMAKPDPRIFRLAMEQAECTPAEAVMIGDRLDNDLAPARALQMGTIWIRKGFGGLGRPGPGNAPDAVVHELPELLKIL